MSGRNINGSNNTTAGNQRGTEVHYTSDKERTGEHDVSADGHSVGHRLR